MAKLKKAHELAGDRIIASSYCPPKDDNEETIEFVTDFEYPGDNTPIDSDGYGDAFIESEKKPFKKKKEKIEGDIRVQEKETIHYDDKIREVHWEGHFLDYGGFARMNRAMAFGLSNRNVRVKILMQTHLEHVNKTTRKYLDEMARTEISPEAPIVYGVTVPTSVIHPGKKIIYTMIETSEKIHPDYSGKLNLADEIWVATKYCKDIFKQSGVNPPIYVMPLGTDINHYAPNKGVMNFGSAMRDFKFLSVFRWSYRKGYDLLLKAYLEEFNSGENVSLLIASRPITGSEKNLSGILEDFNDIKKSVNKTEDEMPHIALYTKPIPERNMPLFYGSCNAFVLPSRGEGFCLPLIESSACGLPVISTNCSGHTDFLNHDNSYLVDPEGYMTADINGSMSKMAKLCRFYEGQVFPHFGDKSIQQLRTHLRNVYENYSEAQEKAKKLSELVRNNYTWDMAVDRVYNRLRDIS